MVDYKVIKPGRQRFTAKKYCNHCTKAGLRPATQIRNQGVPAWLSLILAAHRVPLRGVCRYEPSPNILNVFPTISCFFTIAFQE